MLKKYKGDEKFARVHKRIREVNKQREDKGQKPMFSFLDEEIAAILNIIKEDVDAKVYDRNDILKKDAYFGRTVMALINGCLFHFPQIKPEMEDYKFIQTRISQQYINLKPPANHTVWETMVTNIRLSLRYFSINS